MSDFVFFLDFPTAVPVVSLSVLSGDIDAGTINSVGWDVVVVVTQVGLMTLADIEC